MIEIKHRETGEVLAQVERLSGVDLQGAALEGADLAHAILIRADFREARLDGADLRGAYLTAARLRGADLSQADLQGAYLCGADLTGARLARADLRSATLQGWNLPLVFGLVGMGLLLQAGGLALVLARPVPGLSPWIFLAGLLMNLGLLLLLRRARATLTDAELEAADLRDARYDARTRWPRGFDPKARGAGTGQ